MQGARMPIDVKKRWGPALFIVLGVVLLAWTIWWLVTDDPLRPGAPSPSAARGAVGGIAGGVGLVVVGVAGELSMRRRRSRGRDAADG